jgi:hypothetical protein
MPDRILLAGEFRRRNDHLRKRAGQIHDPRHGFYEAMLKHHTYEGYLAAVGELKVDVPTFKAGPISGRREILYARQNGWIVDG